MNVQMVRVSRLGTQHLSLCYSNDTKPAGYNEVAAIRLDKTLGLGLRRTLAGNEGCLHEHIHTEEGGQ